MIAPVVIVGVGMYFVFSMTGLTATYPGLVLAHTALATPFVVVTVSAALTSFDRRLLWAAASMGATPLLAFRRVTLPAIGPGIASGALFAFATSLDEVVVTVFLARAGAAHLAKGDVHGCARHDDTDHCGRRDCPDRGVGIPACGFRTGFAA